MKNRPERQISFLVVWLTMFSFLTGWGQKPFTREQKSDFLHLHYPGPPAGELYPDMPFYSRLLISYGPRLKGEQAGLTGYIKRNPFNWVDWRMAGTYSQPPDLYYLQSGYFCKREWELEKATHIPLRFRLGSLADCNALEGKH